MKLYGVAILYNLATPFGTLKMIGEVHGQTASTACNLIDFIPSTYNGEVWCELERVDATIAATKALQSKKAPKPLDVCAVRSIAMDDHRFKFINIRRKAPFYIVESVLHLEQFSFMFCSSMTREQKRLIKRFEKALAYHMRSRNSTMHLLNVLISNDIPVWFCEYLSLFNEHNMTATESDFNITDDVIAEYARAHWTTMVLENEVYSAAMASYENTRETATDEPIVLDKYENELRDFFVKLFSVIMDVHILSKYMREKPKELMIVAGVNHISRIIQFLTHTHQIDTRTSTVCANISNGAVNFDAEFIDTSVTHAFATFSTHLPAASPLKAFRERRAA